MRYYLSVSEFWHQAFIAALHRCSAEEAAKEATKSVELAIAHWQEEYNMPLSFSRPHEQNIMTIPKEQNQIS